MPLKDTIKRKKYNHWYSLAYRKETRLRKQSPNYKFGTVWRNMMHRCYNINGVYRPKKIKVCDRWHNFDNFKTDMYESYINHVKKFSIKNTFIDRVDNSLGYSLDNCRWVTRTENNQNRKTVQTYLINNKIYTIKDLCDIYGLTYGCLLYRLKKVPLEMALTLPAYYKHG